MNINQLPYLTLIVLFELTLLFLISGKITRTLYTFFYALTRSHEFASGLLTFLYLPGTVIHEFAHLLSAEIMRVPTGTISFTPQIIKTDSKQKEIKMGSVAIAETDPLRRFLIGIAPIIFGLFFLMLLIWLFQYFWPQMDTRTKQGLLTASIAYALFAVSNSMYSSKRDMEGAQYFLPVLGLLIASLYIAGVRFTLTGKILTFSLDILNGLTKALGIVIAINLLILLTSKLFLGGLKKLQI